MSSKKTGQNSIQAKKRPTIEMVVALTGFIMGVLAKLSFEQVKALLDAKDQLRKKLVEVFEIASDPFAEVRAKAERFYLDHFKMVADFSGVRIPVKPSVGSWRLIFVLRGLTMNATLAVMRTKFKVWVYREDLDSTVTTNTRTSSESYAVWVRVGEEPDAEYLGKSTRDADLDGKIGMTLLERMILELAYFVETGMHLDIKGVTLCTGSRSSTGGVPHVYWNPGTGRVDVLAYSGGNSSPVDGLRQAVA